MCLSGKISRSQNLYFLWDIDVNVLREYLKDETLLELALYKRPPGESPLWYVMESSQRSSNVKGNHPD